MPEKQKNRRVTEHYEILPCENIRAGFGIKEQTGCDKQSDFINGYPWNSCFAEK